MQKKQRFIDKFKSRSSFTNEFLVICPQCSNKAKVFSLEPISNAWYNKEWRVACTKCNYFSQTTSGDSITLYIDRDWYFQLPLYYTIETKNGSLYAYNDEHLNYIEKYIFSELRERKRDDKWGWSNQSQISRLPKWVKLAKNRTKLLSLIKKLKK